MEFKYRAGERRMTADRSSTMNDRYFSSASISIPYFAQRSYRDYKTAALHFGDGRDLIYPDSSHYITREHLLEKIRRERMREEWLAEEIIRKRLIEEDIMREIHAVKHFPMHRAEEYDYTFDHISDHRFENRAEEYDYTFDHISDHRSERSLSDNPISNKYHGNIGYFRRLDREVGSDRDRVAPTIQSSRTKPRVSLDMKLPANKICGRKRKLNSIVPLNAKKLWMCSLCNVTATSNKDLNHHMKGKKHHEKKAQVTKIFDSKEDSSLEEDFERAAGRETSIHSNEKGESLECSKKTVWYCGLCKVKCNSEVMLQSHLSGKKHKAHLVINDDEKMVKEKIM